jgi:hypothetical protein
VAVCHYHQDRPGVGVCMRCRAVICEACCTRLDGVNHCHACLAKLATTREAPRSWSLGRPLISALLLAVGWAVLVGLGWLFQGRLAP